MNPDTEAILIAQERRHNEERDRWVSVIDRNTAALDRLSEALQPLLEEHARRETVAAARAELHLQSEQRWADLVAFVQSPTAKWILGFAAALAASSMGVRACVPVEPEAETAIAGDPWWKERH
jgi:hypothetical protein